MGFLNPLFLAAAAALAVPLLVHLLHMRSGRRRPFPALRYLRRTERDHARRIRLRQLLLLLLRAAAIVLLVAAGARLYLRGGAGSHEPTALAVVLDNSLSTGVVLGEERMLDALKRTALEGLEEATTEDRVWVLRAGEPWRTPVPGTPAEARRRIAETEPRGTVGSLAAAVERARSLVAAAAMPAAEVHVLGDLQATALSDDAGGDEATATRRPVPALVLLPDGEPPGNRYVASVEVGGGLPPLRSQRTQIAARVEAGGDGAAPGDSVRVRLVVDGRTAEVADAPLGTTVLLPAGPFAPSEVAGAVEIDPDALRTDDRRHFAFRVREPPAVAVAGEVGRFVEEALAVLADAGRLRRVDAGAADVVLSGGGTGVVEGEDSRALVALPPDDPALLPALNRRLDEAGVPWRLRIDPRAGETRLESADAPASLEEIVVRRAYLVEPVEPSEDREPEGVRVRRSTGEPWMVSARTGSGRPVLLLASPLVPDATTLPVSPEMIPLVEWMVAGWPPAFRSSTASETGEPLTLPPGAEAVRAPDGTLHRVDGNQPFRATGDPGIYEVMADDSVVSRLAVNPPGAESLLERLEPDDVLRRIPPPVRLVDGPDAWSSRVFLERRGSEPWRPLLLAALLLLVGEGLLAAGGGPATPERSDRERNLKRRRGTEAADVS